MNDNVVQFKNTIPTSENNTISIDVTYTVVIQIDKSKLEFNNMQNHASLLKEESHYDLIERVAIAHITGVNEDEFKELGFDCGTVGLTPVLNSAEVTKDIVDGNFIEADPNKSENIPLSDDETDLMFFLMTRFHNEQQNISNRDDINFSYSYHEGSGNQIIFSKRDNISKKILRVLSEEFV